jgi:hypothetical protein
MYKTCYIKSDKGKGYIQRHVVGDIPEGYSESLEEALNANSLALMTKAELEQYAKDTHGVDLDRRQNKATLISEIEALDNGNS